MKTILIVHGAFEHGDRYTHVTDYLQQNGFATLAPTLSGHGNRTERPMYITDIQTYVTDLRNALDQANVTQPYAILAHSMGGLVACSAIQTKRILPEKLILSSPFFDTYKPVPAWQKAISGMLANMFEYISVPTGTGADKLTHDEKMKAAHKADTLIRKKLTVRWFQAIQRAQKTLFNHLEEISTPTWLFSAGDDTIVSNKKQAAFYKGIPNGKLHKVYPGMYHEILNEVERDTVMADMLSALSQ